MLMKDVEFGGDPSGFVGLGPSNTQVLGTRSSFGS